MRRRCVSTVLFEMKNSAAMRSPVRPLSANGRISASRFDNPCSEAMRRHASSKRSASRTMTDRARKSRSVNRKRYAYNAARPANAATA